MSHEMYYVVCYKHMTQQNTLILCFFFIFIHYYNIMLHLYTVFNHYITTVQA